MTKHLPPSLIALFFPRDPLPYKPPIKNRKAANKPYTGVAQYLEQFDGPDVQVTIPPPFEAAHERRERKKKERIELHKQLLRSRLEKWNPKEDPKITGNPYKTLFVCRLSYNATEDILKKELEKYGPIRKVSIVNSTESNKSKGYAFVEYEHEKDMRTAHKRANGMRIDGKRILADAEKGRTDKHWHPMYLGGGLGGEKRKPKTRTSSSDSDGGHRRHSKSRSTSRERGRKRRQDYDNNGKSDNNRFDNYRPDNNRFDNYRPDNNRFDNYRSDNNKFDNYRPDNNKFDNYRPDNNRPDYRSSGAGRSRRSYHD